MLEKVKTLGWAVLLLGATWATGGHTADWDVVLTNEVMAFGALVIGSALLIAKSNKRYSRIERWAFGICLIWVGLSCGALQAVAYLSGIDQRWFTPALVGIVGLALVFLLAPLATSHRAV